MATQTCQGSIAFMGKPLQASIACLACSRIGCQLHEPSICHDHAEFLLDHTAKPSRVQSVHMGLKRCQCATHCPSKHMKMPRKPCLFTNQAFSGHAVGVQGPRHLASSDGGAFQLTAKKVKMIHVGCIGGNVDSSLVHLVCQVRNDLPMTLSQAACAARSLLDCMPQTKECPSFTRVLIA